MSTIFDRLRSDVAAAWINPEQPASRPISAIFSAADLADAAARWRRFAPVLAERFALPGWDGRMYSALTPYPADGGGARTVFVKADHALPVTGSVKARGGVYEVLCVIERAALRCGLLTPGGSLQILASEASRRALADVAIVVASTGNLGYSVGIVARAFGLMAEVHMSADAKAWKKGRLRALGVTVVEHAADYTNTVAAARAAAASRVGAHFIDDEGSQELFLGYTGAASELAEQLRTAGVEITVARPLVVYLPCGVGGAPGGITYGLKAIFGEAVIAVFVEPTSAACMLVALASEGNADRSVYDVGLSNITEADGLAVGRASALVVAAVGRDVDAVVAVPDLAMLRCVRKAWHEAGLRLELSAAAGFAAIEPLEAALRDPANLNSGLSPERLRRAVHVVWTTGGSLMPEAEFRGLIDGASAGGA